MDNYQREFSAREQSLELTMRIYVIKLHIRDPSDGRDA
jgi:hypothetical protein